MCCVQWYKTSEYYSIEMKLDISSVGVSNWKQRLETERRLTSEWHANWGSLVGIRPQRRRANATSSKAPEDNQHDGSRTERHQDNESFGNQPSSMKQDHDYHCAPLGVDYRGLHASAKAASVSKDKLDSQLERMMPPKRKFAHQVLSSHAFGWYPAIELFGVAHHGAQRLPDELRSAQGDAWFKRGIK